MLCNVVYVCVLCMCVGYTCAYVVYACYGSMHVVYVCYVIYVGLLCTNEFMVFRGCMVCHM